MRVTSAFVVTFSFLGIVDAFTMGPNKMTFKATALSNVTSDVPQNGDAFKIAPNDTIDQYTHITVHQKEFVVPALSTWKHRLNTQQDAFGLHKISSASFLLSGLFVIGNGVVCGFDQVQDYLLAPTYLFTASCTVTCVASSLMAWKYRSREPAIRNGMVDIAAATTFNCIMALWCSHFSPSAFDIEWVSKGLVQFLTLPCLVGAVDGVVRGDEMVENRNRKCQSVGDVTKATTAYWMDWTRYVVPNFATIFFSVFIFKMFGIDLSHNDYLGLIDDGTTTEAAGYYGNVIASVANSSLVFLQTLRDKKLISKDMEAWSIFVLSSLIVLQVEYFLPNF